MSSRERMTGATVVVAACWWATSSALGQYSVLGKWEDVAEINADADWPRAIHAIHMPTGDILVWYIDPNGVDPDHPGAILRPAQTWDPVAHTVQNFPTGLAEGCSGHSALPDGTTIVGGGVITGSSNATNQTAIFTGTNWLDVPDMATPRYYPTLTTRGNGTVVVTEGTLTSENCGEATVVETCQIFDPATRTWGNEFTPSYGPLGPPPYCDNFSPCIYPWMFVMPNADLIRAGSGQDKNTWALRIMPNVSDSFWYCLGQSNYVGSDKGSAVIYQRDDGDVEVLKCGGTGSGLGYNDEALPFTETIDLSSPSPTWQFDLSMNMTTERVDHQLVLLPTGQIVAIGGHAGCFPPCPHPACDPCMGTCFGGGCELQAAEWIDPNETGFPGPHWTPLASMTGHRGHHSTALLLADATVFSGGGDNPASAYKAEIFYPPYLFNPGADTLAQRPVIAAAPGVISYGFGFSVTVTSVPPPGATGVSISKVTLVRLGAPTHAFDQNQRLVPLAFTVQALGTDSVLVRATAPLQPNIAPPGYYMLFVISGGGVPSVAKYVLLR